MTETDKELQELRQIIKAYAEKIAELKESNKALRTQNMQMTEALAEKGKAEIDTLRTIYALRLELHDARNEVCNGCYGRYGTWEDYPPCETNKTCGC